MLNLYKQMFLKVHMFLTFTQIEYQNVFVHELVHEQETRNLTLHSAAPRAVLNFLFLVRELVLVNPDNALQECCNP